MHYFRTALAGCLLFAVLTLPCSAQVDADEMRAHFIDVGQGDATLLEFSCGAMLIDAGAQDNQDRDELVDYLTDFFARRTDLHDTIRSVIITHNHLDHNRALPDIVSNFHVQRVIENGQRGTSERDRGDAAMHWLTSDAAGGTRDD